MGGEYGASMTKEPVIQKTQISTNGFATLTRNTYGSKIINVDEVMFVDVDTVPEDDEDRPIDDPRRVEAESIAMDRLRSFMEDDKRYGCRVYRTRKGFRYMFTDSLFDPRSNEVEDVMYSLGADELYTVICRSQNCFRARCTPKPWRCGMKHPHFRFPIEDKTREQQYVEWLKLYDACSDVYSTCHFIGHVGSVAIDQAVEPVILFHDQLTKHKSALPLA